MLAVNTNTASAVTHNALTKTSSVDIQLVSAEDDAALAITSRMTSQVLALDAGIRAASDAVGFVDTIDGALAEMANMYQRLRELALMAENGTNSQQDIRILQAEFDDVVFSIESVITHTTYQGYNVSNSPVIWIGETMVRQ